jgi:hypothetical protein
MAQSILIFDFGANEEAAQQARHKFEGWKQAFRLGDKVVLKFDRTASESRAGEPDSSEARKDKSTAEGKKKAKKQSSTEEEKAGVDASQVRILIRLNFSDHEKLSQQRWLDRIPSEEPFKSAKAETIRHSDASFDQTAELFDSLD